MIKINNLSKRYHSLTALNQVSLTIPQGEILGLLGPNGAGKTTLLKLIAGILHQDAGHIRPTMPNWPIIGFKPERLLFPNHLRVREYLSLIAGISNISQSGIKDVVTDSLGQVNLLEAANKRISNCSKGMRQRLGLAQALIGNPPLLLLDEPSSGLDPEGQQEIHRVLKQLRVDGKTIVMSSHQLPEVTEVCTQIVILNHGRVHFDSSMADALAVREQVAIFTDRDLEPVRMQLERLHADIEVADKSLVLQNGAMRFRRHVLAVLLNANYDILELRPARPTLAEIYNEAIG